MRINKRWALSVGNVFLWTIMLIPLFRYYDLIGTGIGMENILSMVALLCAVFIYGNSSRQEGHKELKSAKRWFFAFAFWAMLITLLYELFTSLSVSAPEAMHSVNVFIIMFINILLIGFILRGNIKYEKCIEIYEKIIGFLICLYFFQWILYIAGISISFKLPGFEFSSSWSHLQNVTFGMSPSPRALFSEKSHLAQYMIPYLALCLYSENIIKKHRFEKAIVVSFVILSTVSGNGIILVAAEWLLYFTVFGNIKNTAVKIFVAIIGVFVLVGGYYIMSSIEAFSTTFSIMFSTDSQYSSSKADYRIYRGLDYFVQLPLGTKFIGVGNDHMFLYAQQNGLSSRYDSSRQAFEYFSAWFEIALYYGVIGLILCVKHLAELFKYPSKTVKGLIVVMILLWTSTEMIFSNYHLMYILIIVSTMLFDENTRRGG